MACWTKIKDTKYELINQTTVKYHHTIHCTIDFLHHFTTDRKSPQKIWLTIGKFHPITITPYNDFTISPYVRKILIHHYTICKKKSLQHFTPKQYWHIPIILTYHHFAISWFHHLIIQPHCYKCEPMQYNKKIRNKTFFSKDNSNVPIIFYRNSIGYTRQSNRQLKCTKEDTKFFTIILILKLSKKINISNRRSEYQIINIRDE